MRVALREDVAGNDQHIIFDGFSHEIGRADSLRRGREGIERPGGFDDLELLRQLLMYQIALFSISLSRGSHWNIHRRHRRMLKRRWWTHIGVLLKLGHLRDDFSRTGGITQPPAGHGVAL